MRIYQKTAAVVVALMAVIAAPVARGQFREVYSPTADAHVEIREALATAAKQHKRVILDFGGNWCGDCLVLDIYLHQFPNLGLLQNNYVLVDIDIGRYDKNLDLAAKYRIPLKLGVPALAVLDGEGRMLYSQRNGEFEKMGQVSGDAVTAFLEKWKPKR
ncbi:thioredoxin family protein [Acidipila rosea]|uniref:Thioredoxin-like protein n=1 Tax=Acidipila rosea TaxID=768535 RepID=A0A4R1L3V5_9BACT|nr:thioredoxin family protein [Acidipila rosea]MBW4045920.1 thioredoxin family protein [Acidobacteriota bacterium]TCK71633.1 thioredoxin-like protein [Acidipila rosea]